MRTPKQLDVQTIGEVNERRYRFVVEMHLGRLALAYRGAMMARLRDDPEFLEWGLRPPSMGTLRVIAAHGPISQREVSERLGVHPSDMVTIIDQLAASGLVSRVRSEADRRRYDLTLTLKGRAVMDRFLAIAREVDQEFYGALSATEQRRLEALLSKLVAAHSQDGTVSRVFAHRSLSTAAGRDSGG
jgi:DNA-binding MarR family transcriptional regulator